MFELHLWLVSCIFHLWDRPRIRHSIEITIHPGLGTSPSAVPRSFQNWWCPHCSSPAVAAPPSLFFLEASVSFSTSAPYFPTTPIFSFGSPRQFSLGLCFPGLVLGKKNVLYGANTWSCDVLGWSIFQDSLAYWRTHLTFILNMPIFILREMFLFGILGSVDLFKYSRS